MRAYNELVQDLDSGGAHYSQDLSEVDLSDLENLKVRVNDPAGDVLVELGSSDFLKRYKTYVSHVQEWRQQFQKLESVNLRYDNQVIVNPEMEGKPRKSALSASAARAAAAAGVKPAALLTRTGPNDRTLPKPAFELTQKKLDSVSAKKPGPKPRVRRTRAGRAEAAKKLVAKAPAPRPKTVATTTAHLAAHKAETKRQSAPVVAAHPSIPKPSAAIAKQQTSTGSD
jgi:cell division protein FtsQ